MPNPKRHLKLGAFLQRVGHHLGAWRHPEVDPRAGFTLRHFVNLAQIAERAKFDVVFFADNVGLPLAGPDLIGRAPRVYYFEPLTLLSAIAASTSNIGLVGTVSTTYLPPYHLARKFASLDHLSEGRAAWNLVTSGQNGEAANFGLDEQIPHADRYRRAREYVDVVRKLWDSWEDDALLLDQEHGIAFDGHKLHVPNHNGNYYKVRGPLQSGRPVQGYPVLVQAGSSDNGQRLAAETAEVVFTAQQTLEDAQGFYRGLKARAVEAGRDPGSLLIMPGVQPIVGASRAEAEDKYAKLQELVDPLLSIGLVSAFLNVDLTKFPIDGPVPDLPETEGWQSRQKLFFDLARREGLSLRQLAARVAGARGHRTVIGTPSDIADALEDWADNEAADGFNILAPTFPVGLSEFADLVIPELQRRGRFRTEYEGKTLRENLGLARPENSFVATKNGAQAA